MNRRIFAFSTLAGGAAFAAPAPRKIQDVVIYEDEKFYSSFPSIVRRRDGELLVAFRRAPERRPLGGSVSHTDPNSYLMLVRSRDGMTWTKQPELIHAHAFGGSQDPCMIELRDGSLLCASYAWLWKPGKPVENRPTARHADYEFMGGYLVRSTDGGRTWGRPIVPPPVPGREIRDPFGQLLPAYNRGAICQGRNGTLYWAVAYPGVAKGPTGIHLMTSTDGGTTWRYNCPIAEDAKIEFNETSMYETPKGDLVAFVRTANFDDHTVIARSTDGGKSFAKWQNSGFQGHPHHALRLPDSRVWLVYGYRHQPFGVRARILDAECTNWSGPEIVLRDDGGTSDLGYPWAALLPGGRVLSVYYFNRANGTRQIAGTIVSLAG